jgi:hypothetical protein
LIRKGWALLVGGSGWDFLFPPTGAKPKALFHSTPANPANYHSFPITSGKPLFFARQQAPHPMHQHYLAGHGPRSFADEGIKFPHHGWDGKMSASHMNPFYPRTPHARGLAAITIMKGRLPFQFFRLFVKCFG